MKTQREKRAITELLAYVLLIGLAVTLSIVVYNWLRFYVIPYESKSCPNGISLIIEYHECDNVKNTINISVKNKGLFKIDGYVIKINNEVDEQQKPKGLPIHILGVIFPPSPLNPGDTNMTTLSYTDYGRIVEIEVEPFRIQENIRVYCDKAIAKETLRQVDYCL